MPLFTLSNRGTTANGRSGRSKRVSRCFNPLASAARSRFRTKSPARETMTARKSMEPTTHVALNAMEALGYIRRRRRSTNRRNVHVYLTAKGRALKSTLVPLAEDVNRIGVDGIDTDDVATARRVLVAIIDNLARSE